MEIGLCKKDGSVVKQRIKELHVFEGMGRKRVESVKSGDICALVGIEGFEIGDTESPIIPLYVRDTDKTFEVTKLAFDEGIFINPVIPPACAPQDTLVRVALMATHTKEQVDYAVDKLTKCFKKLEIIK